MLCGCTGAIGPPAPGEEDGRVMRIHGGPLADEVETTLTTELGDITALSSLKGAITVGTADGVFVASAAEVGTFAQLDVVAIEGEPERTGTIAGLASRGPSLLAWSEAGLFHEEGGFLLYSPLSAVLHALVITALDVVHAGDEEALWIRTDAGVHQWSGDTLRRIEGTGDVDLVIGTDLWHAVVVIDGTAFFTDAMTGTLAPEVSDLGQVQDGACRVDGSVYLATTTGLWGRDPHGQWSQWTFVEAGGSPASARAVTASLDAVYVALEDRVVVVDPEGSRLLASNVAAETLSEDGAGDVWLPQDGGLLRLKTGLPVSFERDVVPFMEQHCTGCHDDEASNAPPLALRSYANVAEMAELVKQRLLADGAPPMPPANNGTLDTSDYAIVMRWIAGGKLP